MKIGSLLLALAAVVALLNGCGGGSEKAEAGEPHPAPPEELRVTLDSVDGPESVGILMALHREFFKDVGLDIWAGSPLEPNRPASYVAKGTDDFGVVQQPQVVIAREKGMPIIAVGSVISRPTASMIWLRSSKIRGMRDLEGKTIAVPGIPYQERFLRELLARAGLTAHDVTIKRVAYGLVGALLAGRADAIFGGSRNLEGVMLESRGATPVITPVQDLGVPDYEELVVIARADLAAEDPQLVHEFMSAVAHGTAAAIEDPGEAVDAVVEGLEANPPPDRRVMEAQMKATLPLLSRSGHMSPSRAGRLVEWMGARGLIQEEVPVSELLTNDYLSSAEHADMSADAGTNRR